MTLHLIQESPFSSSALQECINILENGDAILLMQNGVYGAHHTLTNSASLNIFALKDDLTARGIMDKTPTHIKTISYDEFVELCIQYDKTISWY